jgi:membrane fusion protein (multidrug efflux system)
LIVTKTFQAACTAAAITVASVGCGEQKAAPAAPPPPTVYVETVARSDVPLFFEAVGSLDGYDNADIRARVRGFLQTQNYADGAQVKSGTLLFTIESTEYVAAVDAAKAAVDRAMVNRDHNRIELERDKGLHKAGVLSQQDLDNVIASVADADGQLLAARAQLETAQLNLSYTQMRCPLDGVAGIALVRIGNLVGQDGPTLLTTVSQIDPIRLNFAVSETDYMRFPERIRKLENHDLAWAKKQLAALDAGLLAEDSDPGVELVLVDGSVFPHHGVVVATNRQIDPSTGTIQVQALAANPDGALRPGQYARARIRRRQEGLDAIVVPERAIIAVQGTYSVAIVGAGDKVHLQRVDLGANAKGAQIIEKGVSPGDRVVVDGIQKVSEGTVVTPLAAPQVHPAASAAAKD